MDDSQIINRHNSIPDVIFYLKHYEIKKHMENIYFSNFTIKKIVGVYEICTSPNIICSEN